MKIDALIEFYRDFSPASIARFPELYSADAWFKDPFNEVRGIPAIQHIFTHMFTQVAAPRFTIIEKIVDTNRAVLIWEFHFQPKAWGRGEQQCIRGVSHLRFDGEGRVAYHRDYWDAAEELYEKIPMIRVMFRFLRKQCAAS